MCEETKNQGRLTGGLAYHRGSDEKGARVSTFQVPSLPFVWLHILELQSTQTSQDGQLRSSDSTTGIHLFDLLAQGCIFSSVFLNFKGLALHGQNKTNTLHLSEVKLKALALLREYSLCVRSWKWNTSITYKITKYTYE